jgi:hypothetical protein
MTVRILSMLSAVGRMAEGSKIPGWIITIYEVLYIFSGDYSFVKPDCITPAPWSLIFTISLVYNIAVFIPVFLALAVMYFFAGDGGADNNDDAWADMPRRPRTRAYWIDRMVRMAVIWGVIMYLSITSLALETLSCITVGDNTDTYRMISRPHEICYAGAHIALSAVSTALLLFFTAGFPLFMFQWLRKPENAALVSSNERFMERWNFLYMLFNDNNLLFWIVDFPITVVVAAGYSTLRPNIALQMGLSVSAFACKLMFIIVRRPFVDRNTDIIQAVNSSVPPPFFF